MLNFDSKSFIEGCVSKFLVTWLHAGKYSTYVGYMLVTNSKSRLHFKNQKKTHENTKSNPPNNAPESVRVSPAEAGAHQTRC